MGGGLCFRYSFSNSDEKYIFQAFLKVDIDLRPVDGGKREYGRLHRMGYMVHHWPLLSDKTLHYRDERKALGRGVGGGGGERLAIYHIGCLQTILFCSQRLF